MMRMPLVETRNLTKRFSDSTQKRWLWMLGRKRRLVLFCAWETLFPTNGRLPVTMQIRAIVLNLFFRWVAAGRRPAVPKRRDLYQNAPFGASRKPLHQAPFGEGNDLGAADDEVVEYADVNGFERDAQLARDGDVGMAGFGDSRGVVVRQDHRGGVVGQAAFHYFPRIDRGAVDGALEQFVEPQDVMLVGQEDATEDLALAIAEAGAQVFPGGL